jgi:hypothetical protein
MVDKASSNEHTSLWMRCVCLCHIYGVCCQLQQFYSVDVSAIELRFFIQRVFSLLVATFSLYSRSSPSVNDIKLYFCMDTKFHLQFCDTTEGGWLTETYLIPCLRNGRLAMHRLYRAGVEGRNRLLRVFQGTSICQKGLSKIALRLCIVCCRANIAQGF